MHIELCQEEIENLSPSEIFCSDYADTIHQSHENADEKEEDDDTDESGPEGDLGNIDKWLCDELQMGSDALGSINKKIAQAAKGEPVTCTIEEINILKKAMLITALRLATDSEFRHSFCRRMMPQALREIQKEIHRKEAGNGGD